MGWKLIQLSSFESFEDFSKTNAFSDLIQVVFGY